MQDFEKNRNRLCVVRVTEELYYSLTSPRICQIFASLGLTVTGVVDDWPRAGNLLVYCWSPNLEPLPNGALVPEAEIITHQKIIRPAPDTTICKDEPIEFICVLKIEGRDTIHGQKFTVQP
jgi:hypothetical protein